jgi:hypothetical protein
MLPCYPVERNSISLPDAAVLEGSVGASPEEMPTYRARDS